MIAKELSKNGITTKEEIYKDAILQVGTFEPFIVQEKTFENFKRIWEKQGLGFLVQEVSRKDKCVKVNCSYRIWIKYIQIDVKGAYLEKGIVKAKKTAARSAYRTAMNFVFFMSLSEHSIDREASSAMALFQ